MQTANKSTCTDTCPPEVGALVDAGGQEFWCNLQAGSAAMQSPCVPLHRTSYRRPSRYKPPCIAASRSLNAAASWSSSPGSTCTTPGSRGARQEVSRAAASGAVAAAATGNRRGGGPTRRLLGHFRYDRTPCSWCKAAAPPRRRQRRAKSRPAATWRDRPARQPSERDVGACRQGPNLRCACCKPCHLSRCAAACPVVAVQSWQRSSGCRSVETSRHRAWRARKLLLRTRALCPAPAARRTGCSHTPAALSQFTNGSSKVCREMGAGNRTGGPARQLSC